MTNPKTYTDLSKLEDTSTARVDSLNNLDRLVLPALRQLLHLDPHLWSQQHHSGQAEQQQEQQSQDSHLQLSTKLSPPVCKASSFGELLFRLIGDQIK